MSNLRPDKDAKGTTTQYLKQLYTRPENTPEVDAGFHYIDTLQD